MPNFPSDIDECEEKRDICNKLTEKCVNIDGTYWCSLILHHSVPSSQQITTTTTTLKPPPLPSLPPKPDSFVPQCPLGTEYNRQAKACVGEHDFAMNSKPLLGLAIPILSVTLKLFPVSSTLILEPHNIL